MELTYPTWGSSENHRLKSAFLGGYVSSQEGIFKGLPLIESHFSNSDEPY